MDPPPPGLFDRRIYHAPCIPTPRELRLYADLQIHSRFSGATSERMRLDELSYYAGLKGVNLLGTGDALHPSWLEELRSGLEESGMEGLYRTRRGGLPFFITQTEVATVHDYAGKARRIHHVILMPSLEVAQQLADRLSRFGDLASDGRPVLNMDPAELVEIVMSLDSDCFVFPAHAWTPWWSIFGAIGGVDRVEECYGDMSKHIHAIETGLSSDPPMNWRVSWLDSYILLSSSDAHSPYPFRLGRELVVYELEKPSYHELIEAMRQKDSRRVLMTLEVPPSYGKYHWSGHRACGVGPIPPPEARALGYRCPSCGRKLTKGVDDRVEELADRPPGHRPPGAIDFQYIIPLQELVALSMGIDPAGEGRLQSKKVWDLYYRLVSSFGNELKVLLEVPPGRIAEAAGPALARLISMMRKSELSITPGYDGVYGRVQPVSPVTRHRRGTETKESRSLRDYV